MKYPHIAANTPNSDSDQVFRHSLLVELGQTTHDEKPREKCDGCADWNLIKLVRSLAINSIVSSSPARRRSSHACGAFCRCEFRSNPAEFIDSLRHSAQYGSVAKAWGLIKCWCRVTTSNRFPWLAMSSYANESPKGLRYRKSRRPDETHKKNRFTFTSSSTGRDPIHCGQESQLLGMMFDK